MKSRLQANIFWRSKRTLERVPNPRSEAVARVSKCKSFRSAVSNCIKEKMRPLASEVRVNDRDNGERNAYEAFVLALNCKQYRLDEHTLTFQLIPSSFMAILTGC
jgi:hypothetical protein